MDYGIPILWWLLCDSGGSAKALDQRSFEQQWELATHAERSNQQQAQKTLDVAIWGSSADVLMPSIAR